MGWRRWLGGSGGTASGPGPLAFDALIDLNPGDLPAGLSREAAVAVVVAAVGALPGAGWISVEVHPRDIPVAARVFPAGTSTPQTGEAWRTLQIQVYAATEQSLLAQRTVPAAQGIAAPDSFEEAFAQRRKLDNDQEFGTSEFGAQEFGQRRPVRGFGEAMASPLQPGPVQMDALAELMALARTAKQPVRAAPQLVPASQPAPSGGVLACTVDLELMTRLLEFVLPTDGRSTADAAVRRFGSFAAVLAAPESELRRVPGLGVHSRAAIKLVHAAAVRLARAGVTGQPVLEDSERLVAYLTTALARERVEQFRILFLDDRGMLKADEVQATGTVNHTPVYPREVVRRALELTASSVVLVHNHPSGDPTPSRDDIEMTRQIQEAAGALSITVRDHLIIGNGRWLSFREAGLLD